MQLTDKEKEGHIELKEYEELTDIVQTKTMDLVIDKLEKTNYKDISTQSDSPGRICSFFMR